jgi:hypothetical protein
MLMAMARQNRPRRPAPLVEPSDYAHPEHGTLSLRGTMTAGTRRQYAEVRGAGVREDAYNRAIEYLFERLAVCWTVGDVAYERQKELLGRFRMASREEREFVLASLRAHVAEHFPEVPVP